MMIMEKTISDVREDYEKLMFDLYVNKNITYSPNMDNIFIRGNFSYGGYSTSTFKKVFTSDIDGTATKDKTLTYWWIDGLTQANKLIRRIGEKLHEYMEKIPFLENPDDVKQSVKAFSDDLVRCNIHYDEFKEASKYAAENVVRHSLVPSYDRLVKELERHMGYIVSLSSGSPLECCVALAQRLNITPGFAHEKFGVQDSRIFGSLYRFDPDTKRFTGEIVSGLDNKVKMMKNIHRATGCEDDLSVLLDDNPRSAPASVAGMTIWAVDHYWLKKLFGQKFPGKLKVICPEARNDMNIVISLMKKFDRYKTAVYIMTPEAELELCNLSVRFKQSYENALKSKEDFIVHKRIFLDSAREIETLYEPIVTERSLNVSGTITELESSKDMERDKTLMVDIINTFKNAGPESHVSGKVCNELREIVKAKQLFTEAEWWLQCQET